MESTESGSGMNVSDTERLTSVLSGGALVAYGLSRRSLGGVVLALTGGALIYRGMTGHCPIYQAMGVSTASAEDGMIHNPDATIMHGEGIKVEKSVIINKAPEELYRFWRNFENLPRFMKHLKSVKVFDNKRSHWIAKAPVGTSVTWDAEIINEKENELIAWRSVEPANIANAGSVRFEALPGGQGTKVQVSLEYRPPVSKMTALLAKIFGEEPHQQVEEDLQRFKEVMESGGVAATDG